MRRQTDLHNKTAMGLAFLLFFLLFITPSGFCWTEKENEDEIKEKEEKNQLLVLPIVYYTPETKIAGGVGGIYYLRSMADRLKGSPSTFLVGIIYTQKRQFIFEITPDLFLSQGRFHLVGYVGIKDYVEKFYGIGSQTTENMEENFSYRSLKLKCSLRRKFSPSFYVGVRYDLEHLRISEMEPDGILDTGDIVGKEGGTISGLSVLLVLDSRDNIFFPTRGTLLQTDATVYGPAIASDYSFRRFTFDFRQYVTIFSKHVLAFQQNLNTTSGNVPFQQLPMLGGSSVMRGYIQGRYRDKHAMYFQMEYRVPLFWRLSAAGFFGYGDVADRWNSFRLIDFKVTGGLGIRYRINRESGTNVRLDFGFARGSFGFYAMINEAF